MTGEEKTYSENGWDLTYRDIGLGFLYVSANRTAQRLDASSQYTEIYNLPFSVPFKQQISISNNVGNSVVGNGIAEFTGNQMRCQYQEYGSPVTNIVFGILKIS